MTDTNDALWQRLADLESRLAFMDDTLQQLNDVIATQDADILRLQERVLTLGHRLQSLQPTNIAAAHEETPPPHY